MSEPLTAIEIEQDWKDWPEDIQHTILQREANKRNAEKYWKRLLIIEGGRGREGGVARGSKYLSIPEKFKPT